MRTIVLSLGGSLIMPDKIDIEFLKDFRDLVLSSEHRFIIVCGGGDICRKYQRSAQEITPITDIDGDWIGIAATKLNAELIRSIFADSAYEKVAGDPELMIDTDKHIIIGAGYLPGHSSDMDAVLLAKTYAADTVINMSNIDKVYDADPKKNPQAKPFDQLSWDDFMNIIGDVWIPGRNSPFGPKASREAQKLNLKVIILNGQNIDNLKDCIEEKEFIGTTIS